MGMAIKDIGINLFYAYYTQEKNYQPGPKLGTYKGKVVGTLLAKILLHLQPLRHVGGKKVLLLHNHHKHITEYRLLDYNQETTTPIETILPRIWEE